MCYASFLFVGLLIVVDFSDLELSDTKKSLLSRKAVNTIFQKSFDITAPSETQIY